MVSGGTMRKKEFQKLIGISEGSLRYYEKAGVICPSKDHNGYHSYSLDDLSKICFLQKMQSLGCSVSQCADIVNHYTFHDTVSIICEQFAEKQKELEQQRLLLSVSVHIMEMLSIAEDNIGLYRVDRFEAVRYLDHDGMDHPRIMEKSVKLEKINTYFSIAYLGFSIPVSDLYNQSLKNGIWRLIIPDQAARIFDDPFLDELPVKQERKMFNTFFRISKNIAEKEWISTILQVVEAAGNRSVNISDQVEGFIYASGLNDLIVHVCVEIMQ